MEGVRRPCAVPGENQAQSNYSARFCKTIDTIKARYTSGRRLPLEVKGTVLAICITWRSRQLTHPFRKAEQTGPDVITCLPVYMGGKGAGGEHLF